MKSLIISGLMLVCLFTHAQNINGDEREAKQILKQIELFSSHLMKGDIQALTEAYTFDAKIFPDKMNILSGHDEIMQYWTPKGNSKTTFHKVIPEEISVEGTNAYDYGKYNGITTKEDGSQISWKGKYVIVWKKTDSGWKIYLDIWNRILND